jgi:hypothetical protein
MYRATIIVHIADDACLHLWAIEFLSGLENVARLGLFTDSPECR